MMHGGLSQSDIIIIHHCGLSDGYMLRAIRGYIQNGRSITEILVFDGNSLRILYKTEGWRTTRQPSMQRIRRIALFLCKCKQYFEIRKIKVICLPRWHENGILCVLGGAPFTTKRRRVRSAPFLVPPLGIEPGPTEPESVILSFKLQGHPVKGLQI